MINAVPFFGTTWLVSAGVGQAQTCATYPNTLTKATVADANPVMANFSRALRKANGLFTKSVDLAALPTCGSRRTRRD